MPGREQDIASALRRIARGIDDLADAVSGRQADLAERQMRVMRAWGRDGLTQREASALFREHGFSPQTSGGWARGDWIETRADGLRYLTTRSLRVLDEEGENGG